MSRSFSAAALQGMLRGIEKESLRVRPDGALAATPHPRALGSALTHPHITTDFSESQLELITGAHPSVEACLGELRDIHQVVYGAIGDEILWTSSMPCWLPADDAIPIGRYGTSNIGRAKNVYRHGLSWRYGRRMQAISGIHYNWSLPGLSNDDYFGLIRNFRRHAWLLFYLIGASPAVCSSFVAGRKHQLQKLSDSILYLPHATTLRMGRLGYQSEAQASIHVSFNDLESYGHALEGAMTRDWPDYVKVGVQGPDGEYRQLSTALLQIENEFYGKIRPKRRIRSGERPLHALRERGVEYVEVRLVDLDPFAAIGITPATCKLIDAFLLYCLAEDSPPDTPAEVAEIAQNQECSAQRGREPGLKLMRNGRQAAFAGWGAEILEGCAPFARQLDEAIGGGAYREAHAAAAAMLEDPSLTPSARVLAAMAKDHANSYTSFALAQSRRHAQEIRGLALPSGTKDRFRRMAEESLQLQARMESQDKVPFEAWRRHYLSPEMLNP
ncbi:MAG TPA: glutamate--cysteine ligase [Burkholderiales bacterium]|nr:glutamate--cysteine ligase [Burkholderiales bacterium]